MFQFRSFFKSSPLPCTIDSFTPSIIPTPTPTQFEYTGSLFNTISHTHLFVLNPAHYQFSTLLSTKSSVFNISTEASATQFRFIHNFKDITLKFMALYSKRDGPYAQTEVSLLRPTFQMNFKQILPTFDNRQIYCINLLKSINNKLCLGIEAMCDKEGVGGSLYGRLDIGTVFYSKINKDEVKIGAIKKMGMFTLGSEFKLGAIMQTLFGIKLETKKASVHVGLENTKGRMEVEQRVGQGMVVKLGSEIDLKSGEQSAGITFSIDN